MRFFIYFYLLSGLLIGTYAEERDDFGQTKLNSDLREVLNRKDSLQDFKKKRWISNIDELFWSQAQQKTSVDQKPAKITSCFQNFRAVLSLSPYNLVKVTGQLTDCLQLSIKRPAESALYFFRLIKSLSPIFIFSFLSLFLLHLALWRPAIQQDLINRLQSRSFISFVSVLVLCFSFILIFKLWMESCLLLSGLCILYSREKKKMIWLAALFSFLISFTAFFNATEYRLEQASVEEGLAVGRNSVAFSKERLSTLEPWQKSLWSHYNQDQIQEKKWLDRTNASFEKDILEANLNFSPASPERSLSSYQQLETRHPNTPIVLFNLSQLLTQTQDLISADEYRSRMSEDVFNKLLLLKESSGEQLVYPLPKSYIAKAFQNAFKDFSSLFLSDSGFQLRFLILFILPWLVFFFFYVLRNKSSGLCSMTHLATASSNERLSQLALAATQRSEAVEPNIRQRYTRAQRRKDLRASHLYRLFSLFVVRADRLLEGKLAQSFFLTFAVYSILWFSLSFFLRAQISYFMGHYPELQMKGLGFSISLFILGLGLLLIFRMMGQRRMIL